MYGWQVLTLARAERILFREDCRFGCEEAILASVKGALYHIGQRNFPAPEVTDPPRPVGAGPAVMLRWEVDGRRLDIGFWAGELSSCRAECVTNRGAPDPEPVSRESVRDCAQWLLFGEEPWRAKIGEAFGQLRAACDDDATQQRAGAARPKAVRPVPVSLP